MILELHDEKEPCQDLGEEDSNRDNSRIQGLNQAEARCYRSGKKTSLVGGQQISGSVGRGGRRRSWRNKKGPDWVEALEAMAKSLEFIF